MRLTLNESVLKAKVLRVKREKLLEAFDIYKSNVNYGAITETEQEHEAIISWYHRILDLDEDAIDNVPEKVAQYL